MTAEVTYRDRTENKYTWSWLPQIVDHVEIMLALFALFRTDHHDPELLCEPCCVPHLIPLFSWFLLLMTTR